MNDTTRTTHGTGETRPALALYVANSSDAQLFGQYLQRLGLPADLSQPGGFAAALAGCELHSAPEVLVVDLDGQASPLQAIAELSQVCPPSTRLVALGSAHDLNLYRALLHAGVHDYLCKPVPLDQFASTLRRARDPQEHGTPGSRTGRTLAVTGVGGGRGTSTVVAALGRLLSVERHSSSAVVDFDRGRCDQALLLGHEGDAGLAATLAAGELDSRLLERAIAQVDERLYLLAQNPDLHSPDNFSREHLLNLGAGLCQLFNQVIWDLPSGRCHGALDVLAHADTRILLCDFSVQDARNCVRLLGEIGDESNGQRLLLVANPQRPGHSDVVEREQFEDFIGRKVDLTLPHAGSSLADSLLAGPLQLNRAPALRQALLDLADMACGRTPVAVPMAAGNLILRLRQALGRTRRAA
ncbi:MAG: hypothetical protein P0Y58_19285 [Candidatus Pseudomonas phytovorans]|uniref:Response regulatory domain-containing protein n=1 Tax=Candidatus Pseudomonas phytovorans TaxID=3121377 RepID=A0AAJ5WG05_9PSED|nr:hypothetical protein [Pseudomonas sp.]WEK29039.1 MAG: hypothetical protein P0Y58_19285 [Pseudomonas sp.]